MRHLIFAIAAVCTTLTAMAQEKPTAVKSTINGVTIFTNGAEIQRSGTIQLKAGAQQVVFEGLPLNLNAQSIQVSGKGNFTLLGVSHRANFLQKAEQTKEVKKMEDSLQLVSEKIQLQKAGLSVIISERNLLKANESIGGAQTGVKTADLATFADYYRTRLTDLGNKHVKSLSALKEMQKDSVRLQKQLNELQRRPQQATMEVVLDLTAPAAGNAQLNLSYLVYEAGWNVNYDLRSDELDKPIALTYKAIVYQNTGEDWKNVKPVFSTANPTVSNTQPVLNPWYLSFVEPQPPMAPRVKGLGPQMKAQELMMMEDNAAMPMFVTTAAHSTVSEARTSVEFSIDVPCSISGNGQEQTVELAQYSLPATYEYYAVRKLEKDAFLLAKTTGWENLNLLPGQANIFFEGKYVGESYISTEKTGDTLALSLGRDKNISITRTRKKEFSEKQFLSSNITETREWDLSVQNKKGQAITITVEDQIPVSTNKEIKVEAINISNGTLDTSTGLVKWTYTLQPKEIKAINLKYSIKYPKDKKVVLE